MNMHTDVARVADGMAELAAPCLRREPRSLSLVLQGGGPYGAFTWGVLDRLLDEDNLSFEGVVATGGGAMNVAVLAYGLAEGGRRGAQKTLANFWRRVSHISAFNPLRNSPAFDMATRLMSPYLPIPTNLKPLKSVLESSIDIDSLRGNRCPLKLNICATNVRTDKVRVFRNDDVSIGAILASACPPFLLQAVEIDGEAYWDGGCMGSAAIFALIRSCETPDVLIVHPSPIERAELPASALEILNRVSEIGVNASLLRELQALAFIPRPIDSEVDGSSDLKRIHVHGISDDETVKGLGRSGNLEADWGALTELRDMGRECADEWLEANYCQIGVRSTVEVANRPF